jgi:uncharacterized protein (DUF1697 family)
MTAYVSLFRGINVGGNHQVSMANLKAVHESLGLQHVLTYIQSGNVIFHSAEADVPQLQRQIEAAFEQRFGFHSDVMVRTVAEFNEIIEKNPFQSQQNKESKWMVVMFLAARPDDTAQDNLLKAYDGPEEIFFIGQEMYIYYTNGMGRSKLSGNFIERKLKTVGTARNWNTVLRLQEMLQQSKQR